MQLFAEESTIWEVCAGPHVRLMHTDNFCHPSTRLLYILISFQLCHKEYCMEHFIRFSERRSWTYPREQSFRFRVCRLYLLDQRQYIGKWPHCEPLGEWGTQIRHVFCTFKLKSTLSSRLAGAWSHIHYLWCSLGGSWSATDGGIREEIISRITKATAAFANLLHLWCHNILLSP